MGGEETEENQKNHGEGEECVSGIERRGRGGVSTVMSSYQTE